MNEIIVIGVNHKIAPVEVRERLAFGPERAVGALRDLLDVLREDGCCGAPEVALLSTCNRTEVYAYAPGASRAEEALSDYLCFVAGQAGPQLCGIERNLLYVRRGEEAAHHLLRVAAGLDSLVVGENEILGQVKDAYEAAHAAGTAGPMLAALFRRAVQAGKRVRTHTEIGRAALSVATIVVELAQDCLGNLSSRTALLIGAGKMSALTANALVRAGLRCVLVANRTHERAQALAARLGGQAVRFDALADNLVAADIVICSTCAPHLVLHAVDVHAAMQARPERPLLVVDLAVPRDADPAIAGIPGVRLVGIDGLETLVRERHPLTVAVREAAEAIAAEETAKFGAWYEARAAAPLIQTLCARAEAVCERELTRALPRLGDLSSHQRQVIETLAHAIANKLLHAPITNLKEPPADLDRAELLQAAETLFGLSPSSPAANQPVGVDDSRTVRRWQ